MRMIILLVLVLLLTSCMPRLDRYIIDVFSDICRCDSDRCECIDLYTNDTFILDCTGVELTGIASIAKECKAVCLVDGDDWCENR